MFNQQVSMLRFFLFSFGAMYKIAMVRLLYQRTHLKVGFIVFFFFFSGFFGFRLEGSFGFTHHLFHMATRATDPDLSGLAWSFAKVDLWKSLENPWGM